MLPRYQSLIVSLCLFSISLAANLPLFSREAASSKSFYTVFPKSDGETSKIAESIKRTLGTNILLPRTDDQAVSISWTVEASLEEASELRSTAGVASVAELQPSTVKNIERAVAISNSTVNTIKLPHVVVPLDPNNQDTTNETEQFLRQLGGTTFVAPPLILDDVLQYWAVSNMTDAQVDLVSKNAGVKSVRPTKAWKAARMPSRTVGSLVSPASKLTNVNIKRDISYSTQKDAVSELVAVSQPSTVANIKNLHNYVYESKSGQDSFVYHLEFGVAFKAQANEFPNVVPDKEHIQSDGAIRKNYSPWEDRSKDNMGNGFDSHGTSTATKAVGKTYGVSKQAKLIVTQMGELSTIEVNELLVKIKDDITSKPNRNKKSVINISFQGPPNDPNNQDETSLQRIILSLMNADIPVLCAAGNDADPDTGANLEVNSIPGVFEGADYPLMVIGSTNFDGKRSKWSQGGDHVFLHAPGEGITAMPASGSTPLIDEDGTSLATPLVSGQVANFLSYDTVPFDTSNGNLVKNMRDYFKTNPTARWERIPGTLVLWNGVTEKDNPKPPAQPPAPAPAPPPSSPTLACNGINNNKWIARDAILNKISIFCADVAKQGTQDQNSGSIARSYDTGTINDLGLSMDWPSGAAFRPSETDCNNYMTQIIDNCDGNNAKNPMNWKYGGFNQVGPVKYNVVPNTARYVPGICSMHVHEYETWDSINGNVGEHDSKYQVTVNPKDGSGNAIFDTTGDQWASDSVPYVLNAYYDSLIFTPESQGGDYIQFQLGDQHWSTDQASNTAKCDVGGWNKALKPIHRDMDCTFQC